MRKLEIIINKINDLVKKYPVFTFFIASNFINGILLRLFTTGSFGVRALFFDLSFVLFIGILSFLIKKKRRNIYYIVMSFIMIAICIINSIYYNYYDSFVSASLLATSVFVKDVGDAVIDFALKATDWVYLWQFIGLLIVIKKCKGETELVKKKIMKLAFYGLFILGIGCALPPYYSFGRLIKLWNRVSVVNTFGVYVYQVDDIVQSLKPAFNNVFGYDRALRETKEYYDSRDNTLVKNEYTGIFEGKNVIAIHAESLQTFTLGLEFNGKEVTPNLNKIIKESMYFNNFYAQVGVGTSSDTEFTYSSSLLPANNGTVFVNYYNNQYVTMQRLLNDKGYYVFSMHGNVGDFWNRDIMHLNMGYDKFYSKSSFEIDEEFGLGLSDESFFKQTVSMIKDIDKNVGSPYYGTLITLTNHTPWGDVNDYSDYEVDKHLSDRAIGKYIKSVNYMDKAIGNFFDDMEKAGLLDNTVIVIYGDHDARLGKRQFDYFYNSDPVSGKLLSSDDYRYVEFNDYDYELSKKVPLIIWSKDMKKGIEIDTPMGMIDAMPTIGNMLNIHNKYALGVDVMSIDEEDAIVVFKDGSYITNKIYYSARNSDSYTISNSVISKDYVNERCKYADDIINISNNIITYDLFRELK